MDFVATLKQIWSIIWNIGKFVAIVSSPITALVWLFNNLATVEAAEDDLISRIGALTASISATPTGDVMGMVNVVFPLTEMLSFWAAWLVLFVPCMLVRWARSFIPTVGG